MRHGPRRLLALLLLGFGVALGCLLLSSSAQAVPANPGVDKLRQPGGETFAARQFGDEWFNGHETRSGHTILRGPGGRWQYAEKTRDGSLRPSGLVVGQDRPTMRKHLRDLPMRAAARNRQDATEARADRLRLSPRLGGPQASPSMGSDKTLVILAQFNDQPSLGTTAAQWSSSFFGGGKSVAGYYSTASGGQFTLGPAAESHGTVNDGVVGWVNVGMNHPNTPQLTDAPRLAAKAAIVAADPFVNYAAYDTNGDGVVRNTELHVVVIAAGQEASCFGCQGYGGAKSLWGHRWSLWGTVPAPTVDGKSVGGWGYSEFGEMHADHRATMGIMVHEIGHDLDLPDLYDPDYSTNGVGAWSVMGYGSWGYVATDQYQGQTPPLPDAWSRWFKGWITPSQVTGTQTKSINAAASGTTNVAVQMLDNPGGPHDWTWQGAGSGEYFLVENRQRTAGSYDEALPGHGLLVWHIDESRGNNGTDSARLVDVLEADGLAHLDSRSNTGDQGDPYRSGGVTAVSGVTNPNTNLINGTGSGVAMSGVGASGATMTATFTAPGTGPEIPANDLFASAHVVDSRSLDHTVDTAAATVEGGELAQAGCPTGKTVWYRYTPSRDVRVKVDTAGSDFDTVLQAWTGGPGIGQLAPAGCHDDVAAGTNVTSALPEFVAQAGQTYWFQAGGYYNSGTGAVASGNLQVHVRVRPVNDDFAAATTLTGASGTASGENRTATKQAGEPNHHANAGGRSVWWSWTAPSSGQLTVDTVGSNDVDTLLAVYTGNAVNALGLEPGASNDDMEPGNLRSRVVTAVTAGTTYRIAVDSYNGTTTGDLVLNWSLAGDQGMAPSAPTGVSAVRGDGQATVSWTPPASDGGSAITGYVVTRSPGGVTTTVADGAATTTTVGGLTNGTSYTFTVRAVNAVGEGPASLASAPVVPAGVPTAPTGVSAVAGDGTATVSWSPAGGNGSPVTGYTVVSIPEGITKEVGAATTSTQVTGLTNGTPYAFTVFATNAVGSGLASEPSAPVTPTEPTDASVELDAVDTPGTSFTYRATVQLTGPGLDEVTVQLGLPPTVKMVDAPDCLGATALTCTIAQVTAGPSHVVDVVVRPLSPGPHVATAELVGSDDDPANDESSASASVGFVCDNVPTGGGDVVTGTEADDVLCGLGGADTLEGGPGDDLVFGGSGTDTLSYAGSAAGMVVNLGFQALTAEAAWEVEEGTGDGADLVNGIEGVIGSSFADQLLGESGVNRLEGRGGQDRLYGYGSGDTLLGGGGADRLWGHDGRDRLVGGSGTDRIDGGSGRDTCLERRDKRVSCEA